jgi:hypothetical protein
MKKYDNEISRIRRNAGLDNAFFACFARLILFFMTKNAIKDKKKAKSKVDPKCALGRVKTRNTVYEKASSAECNCPSIKKAPQDSLKGFP